MDIRNEIAQGDDLLKALSKLYIHGVPKSDTDAIVGIWQSCQNLKFLDYISKEAYLEGMGKVRRQALYLLDSYAPSSSPVADKPLHEQTLQLRKDSVPQSWGLTLDGGHPPITLDYAERLIACWNDNKGIPTEYIGKAYRESVVAKKDAEIKNIIETIQPIFAEWKRQQNLFPDLKKDGWMDEVLRMVKLEIKRLGLGDTLTEPELPPMQKFYFTAGQTHFHPIIVGKGWLGIWNKDTVLVVEAENWDAARDLVIGKFGDAWSHQYSTMGPVLMASYYPGGFIVPDKEWMKFKNS